MAKKKNNATGKSDALLKAGLLLVIVGILLVYNFRKDIKSCFMKPYDIYEVDAGEIKAGDAVVTNLDLLLDSFGTLETTHTKNGAVTGRSYSYFYIVPVFDDYDTYYIAVKVPQKYEDEFDDIVDATWDLLVGDTDELTDSPFEFAGNVQKLEDEGYEYMLEWFEDYDWFETDDRTEIEKYVLPLCLEIKDLSRTRIICIAAIAAIVLGIVLLVLSVRSSANGLKKKKADSQSEPAAENGGSYDGYIDIAGGRYMKSDFEVVNASIEQGNIEQAVTEIRDRTGLDADEARKIADNWHNYYN